MVLAALVLVLSASLSIRSTQTDTESGKPVAREPYPPHLEPATAHNPDLAPGPPFIEPFVRNRATGARAEWNAGIGLPDEVGKDRFGLLLRSGKGGQGAVGARFPGVAGRETLGDEVSFDYRNGGACTETSPLIVISLNNGRRDEYGCAEGDQSPTPHTDGWTHVQLPIADLPPGVSVSDLNIVFNIPEKSIVIDNFHLITWVLGWPGLSLYVADSGNDRIVRVDNWIDSGWFAKWTTFGTSGSGVNQLDGPEDVFVDRRGRIYIADTGNHRIVRIDDITGAGWTVLGGTCGLGVDQFCFPSSVVVDGLDRIYVTEASGEALSRTFVPNNRIDRVNDMTGAGWVSLGSQGAGPNMFHGLTSVDLDGAWRIHVGELYNQRVDRIDDMSGAGWTAATFGTLSCWVNQVKGVFADASSIYFTDGDVKRIGDPSGSSCVTYADGNAHDAYGIALDRRGRIYFSESFFDHRISRMKNMTGAGRVTLGSLGSGVGQFNSPHGIDVVGLEPSPAFR